MGYHSRKIILTEDGSHTISVPGMNVTYHSVHGAIQESQHVFILAGLEPLISHSTDSELSIFEVSFGSGLNALLTYIEAEKQQQEVYYETIEPFSLNENEVRLLNYCQQLNRPGLQSTFEQLHFCEWEKEVQLSPFFILRKSTQKLLNFSTNKRFNLIYFDAFDPNVQPELWTKEVFEKMFSVLKPNGVLVTYSSKGVVRRAMEAAGFIIEKIPGPKKKREITRGKKVESTQTNN